MSRVAEECGTCHFFGYTSKLSGTLVGECCRYPPTLVIIGDKATQNNPVVDSTHYCGEYVRNRSRAGDAGNG